MARPSPLTKWLIKGITNALSPYFEWDCICGDYPPSFLLQKIKVKKSIGPFRSGDIFSWIEINLDEEGNMSLEACIPKVDTIRNIPCGECHDRLVDEGWDVVDNSIIIDLSKDIPIHLFMMAGNQKL